MPHRAEIGYGSLSTVETWALCFVIPESAFIGCLYEKQITKLNFKAVTDLDFEGTLNGYYLKQYHERIKPDSWKADWVLEASGSKNWHALTV